MHADPKGAEERGGSGGVGQMLVATLLTVVLLGAIGGAVAVATDPATLPIREVQVRGNLRHLDPAHLRAQVAPLAVAGFFTVDLEAIRRSLLSEPWVADASVRRVWPATLRIEVEEQVPAARWLSGGYLNREGERFLAPAGDVSEPLPELDGPEGREGEVMDRYRRLGERLAPIGLGVRRLVMDGRRSWRIELDNGLQVRLGRQELERRIDRFVAVWTRYLAPRAARVVAVDLRYSNGLAVRERPADQPVKGG
ncbi:MAG TPA: cell division protein FtsQ/DivIB [Thiotrichales bacterium]|nr:cell division protein FtsQ/DivIB [Thiotrichales bacterium]